MICVLTILRGREAHLANLLRGLARQTRPPDEMVIGVMGERPVAIGVETPFPVRQVLVPGDPLPLARARNAAARAARGSTLVFLDVDCIPAPGLVADYARALRDWPGLLMGEVLYLPSGATDGDWTTEGFAAVAERHSDRQGPPPAGVRLCNDYRCFWSLNFALSAERFAASGGFDEAYAGYGGEDTDFGRTLDAHRIPIGWMKGGSPIASTTPTSTTPTTCRPFTTSARSCATARSSGANGANTPWGTGSTPSRWWGSSRRPRADGASFGSRGPRTSRSSSSRRIGPTRTRLVSFGCSRRGSPQCKAGGMHAPRPPRTGASSRAV